MAFSGQNFLCLSTLHNIGWLPGFPIMVSSSSPSDLPHHQLSPQNEPAPCRVKLLRIVNDYERFSSARTAMGKVSASPLFIS